MTPPGGLDGRVVVGIRPEHLSVSADGATLAADVELVEALGNEQLVHFSIDAPIFRDGVQMTVDDDTVPANGIPASTGIARVAPGVRLATGERTTFAVEVERLSFFDPNTGAALRGV